MCFLDAKWDLGVRVLVNERAHTRSHQVGEVEEKMKAREAEVADGLSRIEILTAEIDLQNQVHAWLQADRLIEAYTHACMRTSNHSHIYVHVHVYAYVHVHVYVHVQVHVDAYAHQKQGCGVVFFMPSLLPRRQNLLLTHLDTPNHL